MDAEDDDGILKEGGGRDPFYYQDNRSQATNFNSSGRVNP